HHRDLLVQSEPVENHALLPSCRQFVPSDQHSVGNLGRLRAGRKRASRTVSTPEHRSVLTGADHPTVCRGRPRCACPQPVPAVMACSSTSMPSSNSASSMTRGGNRRTTLPWVPQVSTTTPCW